MHIGGNAPAYMYTYLTHAGPLYQYTRDLLTLDSYRPPAYSLPSSRFCAIVTPLITENWERALEAYPDRVFTQYIVQGVRSGFRVGFRFGTVSCHSIYTNMPSASQRTLKIDEFFAAECATGMILGPFDPYLLPIVHINCLGAVPKSTPGRYWLIVDLSHPEGHSPNDGIPDTCCSLTYTSVEEAAQ